MAALETVIELPNGRVNGYHSGRIATEALETSGFELLAAPADELETLYEPGAVAAESTAELSPQDQPTASSATEAQPAPTKAAQHPARAAAPQASPQSKTGRCAVKYVPQATLDREQARLEKLSQAALAGDTMALDELRAALDDCPHIWRRIGDLQLLIETKLIGLVAGNDPLRAEAFRKRSAELRQHLVAGQLSCLAVKMAASRVVATWLFVQLMELRALESPDAPGNIKQLEQGERRFQIAMRTFGLAQQLELQLQQQ